MDYETEEQQVEALKKWWDENGKSVILGVVIGAAAIFGWQGYGKYQLSQAEKASDRYEEALDAIEGEGDAVAIADSLKDDHAGSTYAVLASLAAAKVLVQKEDLAGAEKQLNWAVDKAEQPDLLLIAKIRLARVMSANGKPDDALKMLPSTVADTYAGIVEEARGDLLVAMGDADGARAAYQKAIDSGARVADRNGLTIKLDDLAVYTEESS